MRSPHLGFSRSECVDWIFINLKKWGFALFPAADWNLFFQHIRFPLSHVLNFDNRYNRYNRQISSFDTFFRKQQDPVEIRPQPDWDEVIR